MQRRSLSRGFLVAAASRLVDLFSVRGSESAAMAVTGAVLTVPREKN
jgi:hypothetical protein